MYKKIKLEVNYDAKGDKFPWILSTIKDNEKTFKELLSWNSPNNKQDKRDLKVLITVVRSLEAVKSKLNSGKKMSEGERAFLEFLIDKIPDTVPWEVIISDEAKVILGI